MNKKLKLTISLIVLLTCIFATNVQAIYQSTSSGTVAKNALINGTTGFMTTVRQMEGAGQVMGLKETINASTGNATSTSNNIDVHMQKNTEYGAMIILGISDYGKQTGYIHNEEGGLATTTGNKSGVYGLGDKNNTEWVAGLYYRTSENYHFRYYNSYPLTEGIQHRGDATVETKYWQGSSSTWLYSDGPAFLRGFIGGAFSYTPAGTTYSSSGGRAAIVCGKGF